MIIPLTQTLWTWNPTWHWTTFTQSCMAKGSQSFGFAFIFISWSFYSIWHAWLWEKVTVQKHLNHKRLSVIWLDFCKRGMWCTCHTRDCCFQRPRDHALPSSSWLIYPLTGRILWAQGQCSVVWMCVVCAISQPNCF